MRVLFVHNKYQEYGGEDRAVFLESQLLIEKGHEVKTLFYENPDVRDSFLKKIHVFCKAISNPKSAAILRKTVVAFKPDIIHFHNIFYNASPSVLKEAYRLKIPIILTLHNYRTVCCNSTFLRKNKPCEICIKRKLPLAGIRHRCYRNSIMASMMVTLSTGIPKLRNNWAKWVDQFIVLTEFAKNKFEGSSLNPGVNQLIIKPNFVPDLGFVTRNRDAFFLFVGRLSPEKGVRVLLKTFSEMPDKKVVIIGDGPEKEILVQEYKHAANIEFLGKCSADIVIDLMKRSQALVFPSLWYEGLPYVILEAFSTGTPVIASRLGAMATLIENSVNGMLFSPGNSNELKSEILRFKTNDENMYLNARATYLNHFHPEIHYQRLMKIYDQSIRTTKESTTNNRRTGT